MDEKAALLDDVKRLITSHPSRSFGEARIRGRLIGSAIAVRDGLDILVAQVEARAQAEGTGDG